MIKGSHQAPSPQSKKQKPDPDAVVASNRAAVDAALDRYRIGADRPALANHAAWQQCAGLTKSIAKIEKAIAALSDPFNELDTGWFTRLSSELARLREMAPARAEGSKPRSRKDQLISDLLDIWTMAGHRPGISVDGPTAKFLGELLPWKCDDSTLRRYIRADQKRRRTLTREVFAGSGTMTADLYILRNGKRVEK